MSASNSSEAGTPQLINTQERQIVDLIPYWRNPRRISDEAVNAVAESIRTYGYQQPIVVDNDNVIVIGHTRYAALRRLGVETTTVIVADLPEQKIKQLRTLDNRTGEYTTWDYEKLLSEIQTFDSTVGLDMFFPDLIEQQNAILEADNQDEIIVVDVPPPAPPQRHQTDAEFVCPSCFHSWEQTVTLAQVQAGKIESK